MLDFLEEHLVLCLLVWLGLPFLVAVLPAMKKGAIRQTSKTVLIALISIGIALSLVTFASDKIITDYVSRDFFRLIWNTFRVNPNGTWWYGLLSLAGGLAFFGVWLLWSVTTWAVWETRRRKPAETS